MDRIIAGTVVSVGSHVSIRERSLMGLSRARREYVRRLSPWPSSDDGHPFRLGTAFSVRLTYVDLKMGWENPCKLPALPLGRFSCLNQEYT
jgi:hypothetical protein